MNSENKKEADRVAELLEDGICTVHIAKATRKRIKVAATLLDREQQELMTEILEDWLDRQKISTR